MKVLTRDAMTALTCGIAMVGISGTAVAGDEAKKALIESALSAGPASITENATVKDHNGNVLREGTNGWTCYPEIEAAGPMCNEAQWDAVIAAWASKQPVTVEKVSISYMLAGEGEAIGVSNLDPYATEPTDDNQWVKEGPHLMILVPDASLLEGLSTDPRDPVYVMWKGTPYQHIMVRISEK